MSTLRQFSTRQTPQSEPIPGSAQVENSAGGFSFQADAWSRLERFLILGTDGGTYYVKPIELTKQNATNALELVNLDGRRFVDTVVAVSVSGRNIKQEPVVFALAMAAGAASEDTRRYALSKVNEVCRTGTHLFLFASFVEQFRGWGRSLRRAMGEWYTQPVQKVAYQATKYRARHDYTHRDLLRLGHVAGFDYAGDNPTVDVTPEHARLFDWITHREKDEAPGDEGFTPAASETDALRVIEAFERAQKAATPKETAALIREYGGLLSREMLRTEHLPDVEVQRALVDAGMPMMAMVRNLANLTRYGVFEDRQYVTKVVEQVTNGEALRRARVHPYALLLALKTYALGQSPTNENTWTPVTRIVDALDEAFYASFAVVEPTGKRIRLALDVSGSMSHPVIGGFRKGRGGLEPVQSPITCAYGAAAMALVTARTEPDYDLVAFSDGTKGGRYIGRYWSSSLRDAVLAPCTISPRQRLDDVGRQMHELNFGRTDCALPMLDATKRNLEFDAFVVYTDNETWYGDVHPTQALQSYREKTGIAAKLVVVSMAANEFTIADPEDAGSLDVVGFDAGAPQFISDFIGA